MTDQIPQMQLTDPDWPDAPPPATNDLPTTLTNPRPRPESNGKPVSDAKALRTEHVGKLLDHAYQSASNLKLKDGESKKLREDFPDTAIEIRPHDGIIYISHMTLRERLWEVFGCGHVAEICRERFMRSDANEIAVDLVLMIRGAFVAEGVGSAKYFPNNPKMTFGDVVESAWSEAIRRCCKKFGVGTQVWRPDFVRRWIADNAVQFQGKWYRKDDPRSGERGAAPARKRREYDLKEPASIKGKEVDDDGDTIPF